MSSVQTVPTTNTETPSNGAGKRPVDWDNPRVAEILGAAAKCFAKRGFDATTLAEIGKELGLRKSVVHYYFASKSALIHEVQSFMQRRHLEQVRASIRASHDGSKQRMVTALESLWEAIQSNKTAVGLNIEVWAAARRDSELKKRAAALQLDARKLIGEGIAEVLEIEPKELPPMEALSALILAVLNGLAVAEEVEGPENAKAQEAYQVFLYLLRLGMKALESGAAKA
jgi:AcrR family transcriptional regulator